MQYNIVKYFRDVLSNSKTFVTISTEYIYTNVNTNFLINILYIKMDLTSALRVNNCLLNFRVYVKFHILCSLSQVMCENSVYMVISSYV